MTLAFCVLMLVPVDVLSTSFRDDSSVARNLLLETLYFFFFLAMMLLVFVVVPFSYFFYEEGAEATTGRRCLAGLKYSAAFMVVFVVLVVLGFVLRGSLETEHKVVLGDLDAVEFAVNFMVACTALLGLAVWFTYSAFGLSWLGISFLKGRAMDNAAEAEDLEREISIAREQRRYLRSKKLTGRSSRRDADSVEQVGLLQHKERVLRQRQERLGRVGHCYKRCMIVIRPATIVVGIVLLLLTLVIILSLLLSSIGQSVVSLLLPFSNLLSQTSCLRTR
jgi:LMBR1 domain-containing protein 1